MAPERVNPRMLELEVAKEIMAELFDIKNHEVDEMNRQRLDESMLCGWEFEGELPELYPKTME